MSDRVQATEQPGSTSQRRPTKQERRAAAEAAAARAAAIRARRQRRAGATAGAVLVGLGFAALIVLGDDRDDRSEPTPAAAGTPAATPSAAPTVPAPTPAGNTPTPGASLDPRLSERPVVEAGRGELSTLEVTTLIEGTGPEVRRGQTIVVNYVGAYYGSGEEFDSSWRSGQPARFRIGVGDVIPGWDQGLVGVKVGSRVQLDIPTDLAYGQNPRQGQPAGPLRFVVDVLDAR
ncbi:FKBP-type peptidyl-prolyl cis-trans isomerase [Micromonospora sp. HM5-17]|uniref:FKBP-type peptidyl-prolyl cis-trans isomerase n=1 Tax=Micromonospora sp. HM5-17 TaxID=2487710 RepID=UPI000F4696BD|nr:FKBP-type peptidyl-prolyl cis-trans isomerase [Micromonospora sp. HM5-17]ROT26503.1 peptidylprolyl isomerase [Micromonospora sp. HM5-17]